MIVQPNQAKVAVFLGRYMGTVRLNERDSVGLDEERKAAMVFNLMVVLVSDWGAQPVVNSGSLST